MNFYLKQLKLINFRCYDHVEFEFNPGINIIHGLNAVGKTSLVEAIHCLGFGRSFKTNKDLDLVKIGTTYYNLKGIFLNQEEKHDIFLAYDSKDKRIKHNDKVYRSISEYLGFFNTVCFTPDDLELIKGAPSLRRRFIDLNYSQINKEYLYDLIKYKQILKERNQFLKEINEKSFDKALLSVLTDSLVASASKVVAGREKFIDALNKVIKTYANTLSNGSELIEIVYKPNENVDNLWKSAKDHASYDILMKTTTWGPGRDEVLILNNGETASIYSSQGQIRTICLALKLGLADLFSQYNDKIIIILDDVLSELDINRQNELLKLLKMPKQIFITTTSVEQISDEVLNKSKIIEIARRRED